ncbi:ABC transporter substrate-binding protein [Ktedonospora formicarum]|uniref:Putative ABC transporter substrate-binding lipoprotein YvrC n=1 Tax=Ktedonospora formicarum TaxID=2778364 RepID=A0A8J3I5A4_9CHLR|nr:ABC transporter substrate-binding protein [Ktedonospora formicarum]GHO46402.1 putative ABC transporter substrate-binding lipoprotein YvrC [Ktedonospora formicarum]
MSTRVISQRLLPLVLVALCALLSACGGATATQNGTNTPTATQAPALDYYGKPITMPKTAPQRIISLTASTSEILGALGLQSKVVGVDAFTSYPADLTKLPKVSSANGYDVERIIGLKPDLVLSSGGLTKEYDSKLKDLGANIVDLPTVNFTQTFDQIQLVGRMTFTEEKANSLVTELKKERQDIKQKVAGTDSPKVLLEVDDSTPGKPYVFGGGSFGDELAQDASATNIFHSNTANEGYPQVTDESVISANPQFIILTEDPVYGGNPESVYKRTNWGTVEAIKAHKVYHINSNIMQRPGPRLVQGLRCLAQVVHPDKFTETLPAYCSGTI